MAATDPDVDVDAEDWWYRLRFAAEPADAGEQLVLVLDGLATVAEVFLNGHRLLVSESMFAAHRVDVTAAVAAENELAICCRALAPHLARRRKPRARWRTKLVSEGNLRFHRTMLLGRAPGFAPGPAVAGLWRPVALERRSGLVVEGQPWLRARLDGGDGVLECALDLRALPGAVLPDRVEVSVAGDDFVHTATLDVRRTGEAAGTAVGTVSVPGARTWWPHTHGDPFLYTVLVGDQATPLHRARVGFRRLRAARDLVADGPALEVNDVPVFARGAVWTPLDLRAPHGTETELRRILAHVRAAGMNMLRVAGIGTYESPAFYDLCDELGILVWQDFMFANLDYPEADPEFMHTVAAEARAVLAELAPRPCLAVLCGGSEVAQQVAMLGLDPGLADGPLYGELLPGLVRQAAVEAPYIPSAPWGGDLPFRTDRGVANYYGVGAYLRPLTDARLAEVRFASECLAFANLPDEDALLELPGLDGVIPAPHDPRWKAAVPRDTGAGWDFEDVRDHYLQALLGVDAVALRSVDPDRYRQLSRAVSGEVMAEVFGEWRRAGSRCRGGLVLWLKDLRPGAGWGVLDHRGEPKAAHRHLARALAPVAVWTTDEGLGGIAVHVANDTADPLTARLRVALYRDFEVRVEAAVEDLELPARSAVTRSVEQMLGHFVDAAWAYRFGPPAQDLIAVSLEGPDGLYSQTFRFPDRRPLDRRPVAALGLEASLQDDLLRVASRAFAYEVCVAAPDAVPSDDAFSVEPGGERTIRLTPRDGFGPPGAVTLTALNLAGTLQVRAPEAGNGR
ncbi:MAG: hypothetical protein WBQ18_16095 [Solirubrobacteraceae bacterium]